MDFGPYVENQCYMNSSNSPSPPVSYSALVQVLIIPRFRSYKGTAGTAAPCPFHIGSKNSNTNHAFVVPVSPMASDCLGFSPQLDNHTLSNHIFFNIQTPNT